MLFFTTTGWLGGAERSMLELAAELQRTGRTVHGLFPGGGELETAWRKAGLPATPLALPSIGRSLLRNPAAALSASQGTLKGLEQLSAAVVQHAPAILHANSVSAAIHAGLLVRLKPPPPGALKATLWHCRDLVDLIGFRAAVFPALTRVIAISGTVREHLLHAGLPPDQLALIPNGIRLPARTPRNAESRMAARKALGLDPKLPTVLHISQFAPWKMTPQFLEACRTAGEKQPLQVLLIGREPGDDDDTGGVPATIKTGIDRLRQAGRKVVTLPVADSAAMDQVWAAADLLVHPAVNEPFGRVVLEAMARGVPVLGRTKIGGGGGPAELLIHEKTGWLVNRDEEFAP
ncbi:MAG TPA: glycosyltransferase, partial [Planctomycetota bacterium]|nr:glycosyltransferase [Planctomycetota bacterium]